MNNNSLNNSTITPFGGNFSPPSTILSRIVAIGAAVGIFVNLAALFSLRYGRKRVKSEKSRFLLAMLTLNNALALMGLLSVQLLSRLVKTKSVCALHVLIRMFGVNGGCTDAVIALSRYLAVTKPFYYSNRINKSTVQYLLCTVLCLSSLFTLAPLMGLGAYYDQGKQTCLSYKNATNSVDYTYGIAFVIFGFSICAILVISNFGVLKTLYIRKAQLVEEREKQEMALNKMMVAMSVLYILCWLPQMISSTLYLSLEDVTSKRLRLFDKISKLLLLLNFILDPIIQFSML